MLRANAAAYAKELLDKYDLSAQGWKFEVTERGRRQLGCCYYHQKRITVTGWYIDMNPPETVHDTIRHEVAHALAGVEAGHGPLWVEQCIRVGADPSRLRASETISRPALKYTASCHCGRRFDRSNFPRTRRYYCPCTRDLAGTNARPPLVWVVNPNRHKFATTGPAMEKAAAQEIEMPKIDSEVESLLVQLRLSIDATTNKRIRAKLRKLGHTGGLR